MSDKNKLINVLSNSHKLIAILIGKWLTAAGLVDYKPYLSVWFSRTRTDKKIKNSREIN